MEAERNFYDFLDAPVSCPHCGWSGIGRGTALDEELEDSFEYACPECGKVLGFQFHPSHYEVAFDPRAASADKIATLTLMWRHAKFEETKLTTPDQLPELDPPPDILVWDVVQTPDGEREVHIKFLKRVIWKELSFPSAYRRFVEVAAILKRKYGSLEAMYPSLASCDDLYDEWEGGPALIRRVNEGMKAGTGK